MNADLYTEEELLSEHRFSFNDLVHRDLERALANRLAEQLDANELLEKEIDDLRNEEDPFAGCLIRDSEAITRDVLVVLGRLDFDTVEDLEELFVALTRLREFYDHDGLPANLAALINEICDLQINYQPKKEKRK